MSAIIFREQLVNFFNKSELHSLCFDLNIHFENLPGETLDDKARELITYSSRHNLIDALVNRCKELRPSLNWNNLLPIEYDSSFQGNLLREYLGHTYHINSISVSGNGKYLASCGGDKKTLVWELRTAEMIAVFKHDSWAGAVTFSPNHMTLATSDGRGCIQTWDFTKKNPMTAQTKAHNGACRTISFVPKSDWLVSGGSDGEIHLWNLVDLSKAFSLKGHNSEVRRLAISPNGLWMVSGDADGFIHIWDISQKEIVCSIENPNKMVRSLSFSPNSNDVAVTFSSGEVLVWDRPNQITKWKVQAHTGHAIGVNFHPQKPILASSGQDKLIRLWNANDGAFVNDFVGHTKTVTCIAFTPDGNWLVSGSRDERIKLWNLKTVKSKV